MSRLTIATSLERIALTLVPSRDHDALLGDLDEEGPASARARLAAIVRVGAAYQGEPYRDDRARAGILVLLAAGLGMVGIIPLAAAGMRFFELDGHIWRGAAVFWSHGTAIAATAAGLLAGRAPLIPDHASSSRWHVAVALAIATAASASTWTEGIVGAAVLVAATAVGSTARTLPAPPGGVS